MNKQHHVTSGRPACQAGGGVVRGSDTVKVVPLAPGATTIVPIGSISLKPLYSLGLFNICSKLDTGGNW
ncbi:hypothetical protein VSR68_30005 [Paraburkholderia phymatum]|uniref:hypothetical protein n=1 Tax=Paraburkholderia phymatum TaxID=148447 RepID=UPI00316D7C4A